MCTSNGSGKFRGRQPIKVKAMITIVALILMAVSATCEGGNSSTVYDVLPEFGLPSGLLPSSVTDYSLSDDGSFVVHLSGECYVEFDYLVYYDTTISGKLSYGSITELEGIQVQRFFFWFDVDQIKVDLPPSDSIYFLVGLINKKLDVAQFKTIHSCLSSAQPIFKNSSSLFTE